MEVADLIVSAGDLPKWWQHGQPGQVPQVLVRMIGLTYEDPQYGTGVASGNQPFRAAGLTPAGVELIHRMAEQGFIRDISHLAEEGVWQGLELKFPRVCASHANARALKPTNRHLSDAVIRALAERQGDWSGAV
jgi:membrane dipeptidase